MQWFTDFKGVSRVLFSISLILLLPLAGCRDSPSAPAVNTEAKPRLSILIWEEYLAPSVLERFTSETGAEVVVTEVENSEQLKQAFGAKPEDFDVVVADEKTMGELIALRLLGELKKDLLKSEIGHGETLPASSFDPGNLYTVPYLWGLTVLAGRSEILEDAQPSWSLLWREDLKIALLDEPLDIMWMALLAMGQDPATATEEQIDEATAKLALRFPDFRCSMKGMLAGLDALVAGEADMVMSYNGDALSRLADQPGMSVVIPKEGAPLWLDSFAVSRDSRNVSLAHRFVDFMTRPEISALSANELSYASPNPKALALVENDLLKTRTLYPETAMIKKCKFVRFTPEIESHVNQAMLGLISGSRSRSLTADTRVGKPLRHSIDESSD